MENEELKDNDCGIVFICLEQEIGECVYRRNKGKCKHLKGIQCTSAVANVNRLVLHLKHIGLSLKADGFEQSTTQT